MEGYATNDDLSRPANGLPPRAFAGVSSSDIEQALESASSLANSYLSTRYVTPFTEWADALTWAVCAIAAYNIICGRGFNPANGSDEQIRLRYEDAIDWLKQISKGVISLKPPEYTDSNIPPTGSMVGSDSRSPRISSRDPRGW